MKNVLITGGSGSFGTAMTEKLLVSRNIERLVIYSRGEHLQEIMQRKFSDPRLRYFIGDVRDESRLTMAMRGTDTVFHAAALKIVPTAEYNPTECIETNVRGAENVVRAALSAGVSKVIGLSTDKAVNPINLYGASKLCAEKIFIAANALSAGDCLFSVVRYGNVIGSRGSVLPLFQAIASRGEALPITDVRMTRFWMSLDEATEFVAAAERIMRGREVFIPKIPSIRIIDLAEAIAPGAKTAHVGIRPGEKLHETLLTEDEAPNTFVGSRSYITVPDKTKYYPSNLDLVIEGFRYSSDTNQNFLTVDQIRESL